MNFYKAIDRAIKKYDKNLSLVLPSISDSRYIIKNNIITRTPSQYFTFKDNTTPYLTTARFEIMPKGNWENMENEGVKFQLLEIYDNWKSFKGFGKIKKIMKKEGLTPLYQSLDIATLEYTHIYLLAPENVQESIWRFNKEKLDKIYYTLFLDTGIVDWESLYEFLDVYQVDTIKDYLANYRSKYPNKKIKYLMFYVDPVTNECNNFLIGTQIG
jgi:hypothetical protein